MIEVPLAAPRRCRYRATGGRVRMTGIWTQTKREKLGEIDGLNLFFGALLGANLGTLDALPIVEYAKLIVLLAGAVAAIRMAATSERRVFAFATLLLYVATLAGVLLVPRFKPEGMAEADLQRLVVTLAVWIGTAVIFEIYPTRGQAPTV